MKQGRNAGARADRIRAQVRDRYGGIATGSGCCGTAGGSSSCCSGGSHPTGLEMGYSKRELAEVPSEACLGLGCGNPTALVTLSAGETVLDLGSGAGVDCFLASRKVGPRGRVIGVDMTPEMVAKARANARRARYANVEFRLGEIEHLPAADGSVDVVISNCVVNLAPDKGQVYREAFRVLRPGGRLAISDMVATRPITTAQRANPELWGSCSSGALATGEVQRLLKGAGFRTVRIALKAPEPAPDAHDGRAGLGVVSADIVATKPGGR